MDERELAERLQHFQIVASTYGFQSVPAATVYQVFEELVCPDELGLQSIQRGLYGRVVNDDIVHLMRLQAIKGASHTVWWGVSLSYVPHKWQRGFRWHRSFRSSRFDLFETPDTTSSPGESWREAERSCADTLHGEAYFLETLYGLWERLGPQVMNWFSSVQSTCDVLSKAREQVENKRTWIHHPHPMMVCAFTLGRTGRMEEAIETLDAYFRIANRCAFTWTSSANVNPPARSSFPRGDERTHRAHLG